MSNEPPKENPWCNLSTVTNFDQGSNLQLTKCIQQKKRKTRNKLLRCSSILIGSLLNQLCAILESDPTQSQKLYYSLCDQMHRLELIDPSYKLGEFQFIQNTYGEALYRLIAIARTTIGSGDTGPIERPLALFNARYEEQFRETGFIASGGFGSVYRAVHKLDEVEYAIKKVMVKSGRFKTVVKHLDEVKTLAKLNHTNIVSYKQAWIEVMPIASLPELTCDSVNTDTFESNASCEAKNSVDKENSHSNSTSYKIKKTSRSSNNQSSVQGSFSTNNEQNFQNQESISDIVSFRNDQEKCDTRVESDGSYDSAEKISSTSTEESISSDESDKNQRICQYSSVEKKYIILYIQMTLCDKTLRHWMDERKDQTPVLIVTNIAKQILSGLSYIHSSKIVHHDIKPSNIFISTTGKLHIQLGDFGLACPLKRETHDEIGGTCMYAAPEQLKGECNFKSDIYSLGVVILEVLIPILTNMECIKLIEVLQAGNIPRTLALSHPKWADIISQLVQKNPTKRPSADQLLQYLKGDKDLTITKLQNEKKQLLDEIKKKNEIIEDQKAQINLLLAKLKQNI